MEKMLQVAINAEKKVVSIYDVVTGIACDCTCPQCGEPVEAKNNGKKADTVLREGQKAAHFAHASGKTCPHATETAIHKLAKEIILQNRKLKLSYYKLQDNKVVRRKKNFRFDSVSLETYYSHDGDSIRPDATLKKRSRVLFVEFCKTHAIDWEKADKLEKIGISTIEIDLNSIEPLKDGEVNMEGLRELIEEQTMNRHWIINRRQDDLYSLKLKLQHQQREENLKKIREEENERSNREFQKLLDHENWINNCIAQGLEKVEIFDVGSLPNPEKERIVHCPIDPTTGVSLTKCVMCEFHKALFKQGRYDYVFCDYSKSKDSKGS